MMSNIKWLGWVAVVAGSFLPLVHVPILGNWNYWSLDNRLALICWALSGIALVGIALNKNWLMKISSVTLILFFIFTIFAVKYKAMDSFGFVFVKSLQKTLAGVVKLRWGWFVEFAGALLMLLAPKK
jgi:NO-binding membrane sensor protein with MHYT domain